MNKSELIADLTANVVRVISTAQVADSVKAAAGVNVYQSNVMEIQKGGMLQGRTITFYVLDEGQQTEQAFYKEKLQAPLTAYAAAAAYLATLPVVRYKVLEQNADDDYLIATVWTDVAGDLVESKVMIYHDDQGSPTHKTIA